jgi:hypothetical protein
MLSLSAARVAFRSCITASNTTRRLRSICRQFISHPGSPPPAFDIAKHSDNTAHFERLPAAGGIAGDLGLSMVAFGPPL